MQSRDKTLARMVTICAVRCESQSTASSNLVKDLRLKLYGKNIFER